jgi:hypothetical protein
MAPELSCTTRIRDRSYEQGGGRERSGTQLPRGKRARQGKSSDRVIFIEDYAVRKGANKEETRP